MNTHRTARRPIPCTALAAVLWAALACGTAHADAVPVAVSVIDMADIEPTSIVTLGVGGVRGDNQRFGEYSGLETAGAYGLADVDLGHLDRDTGTWVRLRGRNLGLDSREIRLDHERQGSWRYSLAYSRIPRTYPYDVNTGLTGDGTAQLVTSTITPGMGRHLTLGTDRDVFNLALRKDLPSGLDVTMNVRYEEKKGERIFGRTGIDFLVDPIDYITRQWEAALSYTGERLQLSGGYYATAFANRNTGLFVDGVTDGNNSNYSPIGLPPDNVSHQIYLSGGYNFTHATRAGFKLAYARLTQDDAFIPTVTVAPGVGSGLNGEIRTVRVLSNLTSRPTANVSLLASFRYENRDDRTPILVYYTGTTPTSRTNGENEPRDIKTTAGKVEGTYRLPLALRATGGVEYEDKTRNISAVRSVSAREHTHETSYRVALSRAMSETVNGALSYIYSVRNGSGFYANVLNGGGSGSDNVAPIHYADRRRDKVRLTVDATPTDRFALQLVADARWDGYDSRTAQNLGPRKGSGTHVSADASYDAGAAWQITGFVSHDGSTAGQNSCDGISSSGAPCATTDLWTAKLINHGYAAGVGVHGKPTRRLQVGADVAYSYDQGKFQQAGAPVSAIGNVHYRHATVTLSAERELTDRSGIGLSVTHDRLRTNDWSWVDWVYADGTTLYQDPNENVTFVGATYHYRWP